MQPKYQIGDEVYFLYGNNIYSYKIIGVLLSKKGEVKYCFEICISSNFIFWHPEEELFPSRQALIDSL